MNRDAWAEQKVPPDVALALLESLRAADLPTEQLKDEDVQQSLPRRLGLSPVVEANIRRYAELSRDGGSLRAQEVGELLQLVSRRPDARAVFASTGRRLARGELSRRRIGARSVAAGLPTGVRRRLGMRGLYRIARQLAPDGAVQVESKLPGLVVNGGLLARACRSDAGCQLLNAAFEESMGIFRADEGHVAHVECEGRGDSRCLWVSKPS